MSPKRASGASGSAHAAATASASHSEPVRSMTISGLRRLMSEVYRDLLHRKVDPLGLFVWGTFLDEGLAPTEVVELIQTTGEEYRHAQVNDLFEQYLHRPADPLGLAYFTDLLETGSTVEQVAAIILGSPEYYQIHGSSNDGFLTALTPDTLGRPLTAMDQGTQGAALASGTTRDQVAASLLSTDEYRLQLVGHYYDTMLDRPLGSDPFGTTVWPLYLKEAVSDEVVIALILGDPQGEFFNKTAS